MKSAEWPDAAHPSRRKRDRLRISRRRRNKEQSHFGGVWKVAYADFVTAMMAFFLLMWLISTSSRQSLLGIAQYFSRPIIGLAESPADSTFHTPLSSKEDEDLQNLRTNILAAVMHSSQVMEFYQQIRLDTLPEGLRIQLVDDGKMPMFDRASAELDPHARQLLKYIAQALNRVDNSLSVAGHTDATPFGGKSGGLGNWELSSRRASAALTVLLEEGLDQRRVLQVVGHADRLLQDRQHPEAAVNRRISILILTRAAAAALLEKQKDQEIGPLDRSPTADPKSYISSDVRR